MLKQCKNPSTDDWVKKTQSYLGGISIVVVIQSVSRVWLFATPWTAENQTSLSLIISWSSPKFMFIKSVMPSTISSSFALFSFCLQPFPASGSFPMSRLSTSGGQNIEDSASASVLPMSIQGLFPLGLTTDICVYMYTHIHTYVYIYTL